MSAADERAKDIRFSSRTRYTTDQNQKNSQARRAFATLAERMDPALRETDEFRLLAELAQEPAVSIAQLIYRDKPYERSSKDYEFSRATMLEHWTSGVGDASETIRNAAWLGEPLQPGIVSYAMNGERHDPR